MLRPADRTRASRPARLVLVGAVALLAVDAATARWLGGEVDQPLLAGVIGQRTPRTDRVASVVTDLGSPTAMTVLATVVVLVLLALRRYRSAAGYAAAAAAGGELSPLLKAAVARPRPPVADRLVAVTGWAFPSGHALGTTVVLGLLVVVVRYELAEHRWAGATVAAVAIAVTVAVAVGVSRVWLGVHWPTDVVAGWCVGVIWAAGCALIAGVVRQRRGGADRHLS